MSETQALNNRIGLLCRLGEYMGSTDAAWVEAKARATSANAWFTAEHVEQATANIVREYLDEPKLRAWVAAYRLPARPVNVGIVMAGNIPLVGFHDFLCGFVAGHNLFLKLSSKDEVLMKHIVSYLGMLDASVASTVTIADRLNGCDAYIATGSNNSARYFEQYFGKYPHIIRSNRTSVAILDGYETDEELSRLADDVYLYYGLGCRNVTQVCVPSEYDFERLLRIFRRYDHYSDLNKYKNNFDYHLAIYLLNRVPYMSNESLLMVENNMPFSAVSVLHYRFYEDKDTLVKELIASDDIQAIVCNESMLGGFVKSNKNAADKLVALGASQKPGLGNYADGVDTMGFLCGL